MTGQRRYRIHLFRNGQIEVGCTRRGRPSYRLVQGYSQALSGARTSMVLSLQQWRAEAKRDGDVIVIHDRMPGAFAAVANEEARP